MQLDSTHSTKTETETETETENRNGQNGWITRLDGWMAEQSSVRVIT